MISLYDSTAKALETLSAQYKRHALLLIHPNSRHRVFLLTKLLAAPPCPLYFYDLGPEDTGLDQFLTGLIQRIGIQSPGFGQRVNAVRETTGNDTDRLAQAFAGDLSDLETEDFLLILDEFDRADGAWDIQSFIERLLEYIPPHCHFLLNSRTLPPLPWTALIARNKAAVVDTTGKLSTGY